MLPRQAMMPSLSPWERVVALLTSLALPLPGIVALLALLTRRRAAFLALGASLGIFGSVYGVCEARCLKGRTPPARWPLLLLGALLLRPSRRKLGYALLYFGYSFSIFARLNARYLRNATPWTKAWWVPVIQVVFPVQLLIALLSPQRINWRGNIVQVERGGGFRYIRSRSSLVQKGS